MLSAQITATDLSVNHSLNGAVTPTNPAITNPNIVVDGTMTVAQLITYADSLLAATEIQLQAARREQSRNESKLFLTESTTAAVSNNPHRVRLIILLFPKIYLIRRIYLAGEFFGLIL
jgi:hypothetical protein